MCLVIFETVKVLISFVAYIALVWLLLLHANSAWIWLIVIRVQNGKGAISVLLQPLVLVTMSLVVFQAVSITI